MLASAQSVAGRARGPNYIVKRLLGSKNYAAMTIPAKNEMIFCVQSWQNHHTEEKQMTSSVSNGRGGVGQSVRFPTQPTRNQNQLILFYLFNTTILERTNHKHKLRHSGKENLNNIAVKKRLSN